MVEYITSIPSESDTEERKFTYPYVSCEILSSNINKINDYFSTTNQELNNDTSEKKDNIDLLDKLLDFIERKEILNDILSGYFSKVFIHLIQKYPFKILSYMYQKKYSSLQNLIYHSYQPGISDVAIRLLSLESYIFNDTTLSTEEISKIKEEYEKAAKPRNDLIYLLLHSISLYEEDISSKINLINNLAENEQILNVIANDEKIISEIFFKVTLEITEDQNNNFYFRNNYGSVIDLLTIIVSECFELKANMPKSEHIEGENSKSTIQIKHSTLSQNLYNNIEIILSNFKRYKNPSSSVSYNNASVTPLGIINIKLLDFVTQLLNYTKNISLSFDNILIKTNFIKTALDFLFEYQFNNIYQQSFITMFKTFINEELIHKSLSSYIFNDLKLTLLLMNYITNSTFKYENSNVETKSGIFSSLIYLCYKINTIGGGKAVKVRSREGSFYFVAKTSDNYLKYNHNTGANNINISFEIKYWLNEEWDIFFNQEVSHYVKLFETRLCDDNYLEDEIIIDDEDDGLVMKKESPEKKEEEENPLPKEVKFFKEIEEDMKNKTKEPEIDLEIQEKVKVDEVDLNNYNDINYWKSPIIKDPKEGETILKELE